MGRQIRVIARAKIIMPTHVKTAINYYKVSNICFPFSVPELINTMDNVECRIFKEIEPRPSAGTLDRYLIFYKCWYMKEIVIGESFHFLLL